MSEPLVIPDECSMCFGSGEISLIDRSDAPCPACVAKELNERIARLEQQLANARKEALREAANACGESDGWDMNPKDYEILIRALMDKEKP